MSGIKDLYIHAVGGRKQDGQLGISLSGEEEDAAKPEVTPSPVNSREENNFVDFIRNNDTDDGGEGNDILKGTNTEWVQLAAKEQKAHSGQTSFREIYSWLSEALAEKGVTCTDSTLLWLRGAAEANAGRGALSELIRSYSEAQLQLRFGVPIPPDQTRCFLSIESANNFNFALRNQG